MEFTKTYKGEQILFSEGNDVWYYRGDYGDYKNVSLDNVKRWIDAQRKKDFVRYEAYYAGAYNGIRKVTVTSETEDGKELWIVEDGSRSKVKKSNIFPITDANNAVFAEWADKQRQKDELNRRNKALSQEQEVIASKLTFTTKD